MATVALAVLLLAAPSLTVTLIVRVPVAVELVSKLMARSAAW